MDRKTFWDNKIINWENKRYSSKSSVEARLLLCLEIIAKIPLKEIKILEIGCGSGILADYLFNPNKYKNIPKQTKERLKDKTFTYAGIDISSEAINKANERGLNSKFENLPVMEIEQYIADNNVSYNCIISLGVIDWLDDKERQVLSKISKTTNYFIHSFSINDHSLIQKLHKLYVFCLYGYKTQGYVPKYDDVYTITALFGSHHLQHTHQMNIGRIITNV